MQRPHIVSAPDPARTFVRLFQPELFNFFSVSNLLSLKKIQIQSIFVLECSDVKSRCNILTSISFTKLDEITENIANNRYPKVKKKTRSAYTDNQKKNKIHELILYFMFSRSIQFQLLAEKRQGWNTQF